MGHPLPKKSLFKKKSATSAARNLACFDSFCLVPALFIGSEMLLLTISASLNQEIASNKACRSSAAGDVSAAAA